MSLCPVLDQAERPWTRKSPGYHWEVTGLLWNQQGWMVEVRQQLRALQVEECDKKIWEAEDHVLVFCQPSICKLGQGDTEECSYLLVALWKREVISTMVLCSHRWPEPQLCAIFPVLKFLSFVHWSWQNFSLAWTSPTMLVWVGQIKSRRVLNFFLKEEHQLLNVVFCPGIEEILLISTVVTNSLTFSSLTL